MADKIPAILSKAIKIISARDSSPEDIKNAIVTVFVCLSLMYTKKLAGTLDKIKAAFHSYFDLDVSTDAVKSWYKNGKAGALVSFAGANYDIDSVGSFISFLELLKLFKQAVNSKVYKDIDDALRTRIEILKKGMSKSTESVVESGEELVSDDIVKSLPPGISRTYGNDSYVDETSTDVDKSEFDSKVKVALDSLKTPVGSDGTSWVKDVIKNTMDLLSNITSEQRAKRLTENASCAAFNSETASSISDKSKEKIVKGSDFRKACVTDCVWTHIWNKISDERNWKNGDLPKTVKDLTKELQNMSKYVNTCTEKYAEKLGKSRIGAKSEGENDVYVAAGVTVYELLDFLKGSYEVAFKANHFAGGSKDGRDKFVQTNDRTIEKVESKNKSRNVNSDQFFWYIPKNCLIEIGDGSVVEAKIQKGKKVVNKVGVDCFNPANKDAPWSRLGGEKAVEKLKDGIPKAK